MLADLAETRLRMVRPDPKRVGSSPSCSKAQARWKPRALGLAITYSHCDPRDATKRSACCTRQGLTQRDAERVNVRWAMIFWLALQAFATFYCAMAGKLTTIFGEPA